MQRPDEYRTGRRHDEGKLHQDTPKDALLDTAKDWREKFKGQFDQGWDKVREETYQRQLKRYAHSLRYIPE